MALTDLLLHTENKFGALSRITERFVSEVKEEKTSLDWIRASQVYGLCPRRFVLDYWSAPTHADSFDFVSRLRMDVGTYLHGYFQNKIYGPLGIMYGNWRKDNQIVTGYQPSPEWEYVETTVHDDTLRLRGHIDGIMCANKVRCLGGLSMKEKLSDYTDCKECDSNFSLFELKTSGSYVINNLSGPKSIAPYYRTQATVYQRLSGIPATIFKFINRETFESTLLFYESEDYLWELVVNKCNLIWDAIKNIYLPRDMMPCKSIKDKDAKKCGQKDECFNRSYWLTKDSSDKAFKSWVRKQVDRQPDRQWVFPIKGI